MLVEFRVKNFRSIRDEQVLSMVASSDRSLEETHVLKPDGIPQRLLKSAAVYGPNAGGKSNLLQALDFMKNRVVGKQSPYHFPEGDKYEDCPTFRLDRDSKISPGEFEVTYTDDGVRYQYGFVLLQKRILEEWLLVYKSDKPQEWFHRVADSETDEDSYKFSSYFRGQKSIWQKSTRKDALFLPVAVKLNSGQLQPVYDWFSSLSVHSDSIRYGESLIHSLKDTTVKRDMMTFIEAADLGITDVVVRSRTERIGLLPGKGRDTREPQFAEIEVLRPVFVHRSGQGTDEDFELQDESLGTRRLFFLGFNILKVLKEGGILVVDELDSSLHPALTRFIVGLFNSAHNRKGAQLIFTTHNVGLLDIRATFRRDQIWFVEKDSSQATVLYPLTDFNPRRDAAVESGYLTGRYGAIPFLTNFDLNDGDDDGAR